MNKSKFTTCPNRSDQVSPQPTSRSDRTELRSLQTCVLIDESRSHQSSVADSAERLLSFSRRRVRFPKSRSGWTQIPKLSASSCVASPCKKGRGHPKEQQ